MEYIIIISAVFVNNICCRNFRVCPLVSKKVNTAIGMSAVVTLYGTFDLATYLLQYYACPGQSFSRP